MDMTLRCLRGHLLFEWLAKEANEVAKTTMTSKQDEGASVEMPVTSETAIYTNLSDQPTFLQDPVIMNGFLQIQIPNPLAPLLLT